MLNTANPIRLLVTWTIKPGQTDAFLTVARTITKEMKETQPGCEALVWNLAADGRTFHVYEQYTDSDAILTHLAGPVVQTALPKLLQLGDGPVIHVYGDTSPELTEMLGKFGATFARPQFGFAR